MGLFDIFKKKKSPTEELYEKMSNQMFPKGDTDINAGTNELIHILKGKVDKETAKSIFLKSLFISGISEKFDEDRLKAHLAGYCIQHFSADQIKAFFQYITAINIARMLHRKTPSEIRREGETYLW